MKALAALLLLVMATAGLAADEEQGSICIAPVREGPPIAAATPELFCYSGKLSLKIDSQPVVPWPTKKSIRVGELSVSGRHRVTVLCDDKPQQSFRFRYSDFKARELCLFIDLYQWVQLWEPKQAPWCKCRPREGQDVVVGSQAVK